VAFRDTFTFSRYLQNLRRDIEANRAPGSAGESVYNTRTAELLSRSQAASRAYSQWGYRSGNLGSAVIPGLNTAFSPLINRTGALGRTLISGLGAPVAESAANFGGAFLRKPEWEEAGESAAGLAGDLAEGRNEEARGLVMDQAARDLRDMNLEAVKTGGRLTDSAINRENAYGGGMAAVRAGGVEGGNMERNLEYGRSRSEAGDQLMFDMMNDRADDYANAMAQSFSDLSAYKGRQTAGAWSDTLRGLSGAADADRAATEAYISRVQPGFDDYQKMRDDMAAANLGGGPGAPSDPESFLNRLPPALQRQVRDALGY
jgi:hypothetical protein